MSPARPVLHVLTGPTAVGKTEVALRWAEQCGAEIVSCDSLLFYRGMDIGTAKPSRADLARVPHHLIDICDVREPMNVGRYVALARTAVEAIRTRARPILVTGGSGFYLKAFFSAVTDDVLVSPELRAELEARLEREGLPQLVAELEALNGGEVTGLDLANPRRVLRALERCRATGLTLQALRDAFEARPGPFADFELRCVRLEREPVELTRRIARRVDEMLGAGLVAEVEQLLRAGLRENPSAARAIGYRETIALLEGRLQRGELDSAIAQNTRALVRKQRTWFRTQLPEHRVLPAAEADAATLFDR